MSQQQQQQQQPRGGPPHSMAGLMNALGLGAAPADYLKLSLEAIQDAAHHLASQAGHNFNRHQCQLLVQKLSDTQKILTAKHAFASRDRKWWTPALRELYRVLKEAETLIKECRDEPCLKAALRQGDRKRAFAEAFKEVGWCISVLYIIIRHKKDPSVEREEFPEARLAYGEQFELDRAADDDKEALRLELKSWKQEHLCSVEVCGAGEQGAPLCLATQMLKRLDAEALAPGDEAVPSEASYESDLWNVDYEVLPEGELLAENTFCMVRKTTWLGDQFVKKVFTVDLKSFAQEAAALGPLHHPHIVRVFSYSKSDDECCLLMERMSADLLGYMKQQRRRNSRGSFKLPAAIDLMLQIAEGIKYLHSRKMIHRDLKSKNVLVNPVSISGLSEEGFVFAKLADFGLAKTKNDSTRFSHFTLNIGTTKWMAPEVFKKNAELGHLPEAFPPKADVYSFGLVCYEILSGMEPFKDEMQSELYKKLTGPDPLRPQLPTSCPGRLASLIKGCWVGDPRERPAITDVCKELRYLKGLLMTDDQEQLQRNVERPFRTKMVKRQGPWGYSLGGSDYFDGLSTGIRAFKLCYYSYPTALSSFQLEYDLNEKSFESSRHGHQPAFAQEDTGWIKFDYPDEYLVQVEGSTRVLNYGNSGPTVTSLTFTTNIQKTYGPYGDVNPETVFRTDYGRVVGFFGRCGHLIDAIGVLMSFDSEEAHE